MRVYLVVLTTFALAFWRLPCIKMALPAGWATQTMSISAAPSRSRCGRTVLLKIIRVDHGPGVYLSERCRLAVSEREQVCCRKVLLCVPNALLELGARKDYDTGPRV